MMMTVRDVGHRLRHVQLLRVDRGPVAREKERGKSRDESAPPGPDFNNTTATGTWPTSTSATDRYGHNYQTHAAGAGANTFAWRLNIPQDGSYEVFVRYPSVSGAATDAKFTVAHGAGDTVKTMNQTTAAGTWVSLGSFTFAAGNTHKVTLSDQATGTVVADAVKLVRNNAGETDTEKYDYTNRYDANGNLTAIADASPNARVDTYNVTYTGLNQVDTVQELKANVIKNTTSFTHNENRAVATARHDKQYAAYGYDARDMISSITNGDSPGDPQAKLTMFAYTDRGERRHQVKGNGNTVDYTYHPDGLLNVQTEKRADGTLVSQHVMDYDLNRNRIRDVTTKMNADNHSAYLNTTYDYIYDPRDRVRNASKTGDGAGVETYIHDANNNVIVDPRRSDAGAREASLPAGLQCCAEEFEEQRVGELRVHHRERGPLDAVPVEELPDRVARNFL